MKRPPDSVVARGSANVVSDLGTVHWIKWVAGGAGLLLGVAAAAAAPVNFSASPPSASALQASGNITGTVREASTGAPLSNVQVYLTGASLGTLSRAEGQFTIPDVPAGSYELRAQRVGLAVEVYQVTVLDGATVSVAFELTEQTIPLTGIRSDMVARTPAAPAPPATPTSPPTPAQPMARPPELADRPVFTPFSVRPGVIDAREVAEALRSEYPSALRDAGIGGTVTLNILVDVDGLPVRWEVAGPSSASPSGGSSGQPALDQAAVNVARVLRFSPAYNRDERVAVWVTLPLIFLP